MDTQCKYVKFNMTLRPYVNGVPRHIHKQTDYTKNSFVNNSLIPGSQQKSFLIKNYKVDEIDEIDEDNKIEEIDDFIDLPPLVPHTLQRCESYEHNKMNLTEHELRRQYSSIDDEDNFNDLLPPPLQRSCARQHAAPIDEDNDLINLYDNLILYSSPESDSKTTKIIYDAD